MGDLRRSRWLLLALGAYGACISIAQWHPPKDIPLNKILVVSSSEDLEFDPTNVKFYYLTQTFQKPPAFIAFANHPDGVDNSYRRFLIKNIKLQFNLAGTPIRIFCMKARRGGQNSDAR